MDLQRDGSWTTTITIDVPGAIEFKFAANGSWKLSAGEMDQEADSLPLAGTAEITDGSGNITAFIPRIGDYVFTINPADYRYTVTPAEVPQLDDQSE